MFTPIDPSAEFNIPLSAAVTMTTALMPELPGIEGAGPPEESTCTSTRLGSPAGADISSSIATNDVN